MKSVGLFCLAPLKNEGKIRTDCLFASELCFTTHALIHKHWGVGGTAFWFMGGKRSLGFAWFCEEARPKPPSGKRKGLVVPSAFESGGGKRVCGSRSCPLPSSPLNPSQVWCPTGFCSGREPVVPVPVTISVTFCVCMFVWCLKGKEGGALHSHVTRSCSATGSFHHLDCKPSLGRGEGKFSRQFVTSWTEIS